MAAPSFLFDAPTRIFSADQVLFYGSGVISGTVKVLTTPVKRRVALLDRDSLRLVRETVSAADGSYSFANVDTLRRYLVVAFDLQPGGYNATVADYVSPS